MIFVLLFVTLKILGDKTKCLPIFHRNSMVKRRNVLLIRVTIQFSIARLPFCRCVTSKLGNFFFIRSYFYSFASYNVNEFYSFIITINDDHQHRIRICVHACSQWQLNMIRNKYDAWHKVSISYMWNGGEHQNSNNNDTHRTHIHSHEQSEEKNVYELITTTTIMAQEKWQWISSRSIETKR